MKRSLLLVVGLALLGTARPASAAVVYGIQPATGQIVTVNPATGAIINSYATPAAISPTATAAGLTFASPLNELLYLNSASSNTLFRLNPATGAVNSTATGDGFTNAGLSYQQSGGTNFIFYSHQNSDLHRQTGFGGGTDFFWGPGTTTAGIGGDGYGRGFGIYSDGQIHEFDPLNDVGFLNGFAAPAGALGLAFDGTSLFVSTAAGQLLTLNPNTGAILNTVNVAGGALVELGANAALLPPPAGDVPEPATLAVFGALAAGAFGLRRRVKAPAS